MELNNEQYEKMLNRPQNAWFKKSEEEKYAKFVNQDPFPEIEKALLNANDVLKYIVTAGILSPFVPKQLSGVTYTAKFSGSIYFYEVGGKEKHVTLKDHEEFTLLPNSIYFLEIDTYFRVPDYMVLRYNLRVKNVYKGLLLGTGPIIDSGYQGKLFIPLHNLTSNTYVIQKGAKLIDIEFTKLSSRSDWAIDEKDEILERIKKFNFSDIPKLTNDFSRGNKNRPFSFYIDNALTKDADFHNRDNGMCVYSSLQGWEDKINNNVKRVEDGIEESEKIQNQIKDSIARSERRENFIKSFSILTVIAMLLTAITLGITALDYFNKATELKINYQYLEQSIEYNEQRIESISLIVDALDGGAGLSNELYAQYKNLIEQISETNKELKEKRNSSQQTIIQTNKLSLFFSIVALILVLALFVLFFIYKSQPKRKSEKSTDEKNKSN